MNCRNGEQRKKKIRIIMIKGASTATERQRIINKKVASMAIKNNTINIIKINSDM
jgi:hypothetical protein